jgi:hypothetical protein
MPTLPHRTFHIPHDEPVLIVQKLYANLCDLSSGQTREVKDVFASCGQQLLVQKGRVAAHLSTRPCSANHLHHDSELYRCILNGHRNDLE